jgi:hypothetical protein
MALVVGIKEYLLEVFPEGRLAMTEGKFINSSWVKKGVLEVPLPNVLFKCVILYPPL